MCGIVGYVGPREALTVLLPALRRLEYRGYDSAGVATVHEGTLEVRKAAGKIAKLEAVLQKDPLRGAVGIAHTLAREGSKNLTVPVGFRSDLPPAPAGVETARPTLSYY